jgi:hypothetical protein
VVQTITSNSAILLNVFGAEQLAFRPFTILRTRLDINFRSDQFANTESPTGAYGEIIVKEDATAIGITAVPTPLSSPEADWYIYQGMTAPFVFSTAAAFNEMGVRYMIDSKAMRKVTIVDDLAAVFEMRNVGGGFINIEGRQLIQLH